MITTPIDLGLLIAKREKIIHKRNKHVPTSKHYWRYSGMIELLNEFIVKAEGG